MKIVIIAGALLGAATALTTPSFHRRAANVRPASHRLTHAPPTSRAKAFSALAASEGMVAESVKGGAVVAGSDVTIVTGTFVIPSAEMPTTGPTGGNVVGLYSASFWIGIDGVTCSDASLRVGVDIFWDQGMQTYNAWYQWYPSGATDFGNFTVTAGDAVRITAVAAGPDSGSVTVENLGPGFADSPDTTAGALQTATQSFSGMSGSPLCLTEGSWIIEDFPLAALPDIAMPLANFSAVTFAGMEISGASADLSGAQILNINDDAQGGQLTDCEIVELSDVRCARVVGAP